MQCKTETCRSHFFDLYFYSRSEIQQYQKPKLTFSSPVVTVRTTYFSIKKLHLATQCIYELHIILILPVNYFPKQPLPVAVRSKA